MRNGKVALCVICLSCGLLASSTCAQAGRQDNDYPTESLKAGEQGTVEFQVDVGVDGRASNCVVLTSSGFPRLDKATCDVVIRRARFKPATDRDGGPAKRVFKSKMNWVIPNR
jgi:protein TonB